MTGKNDSPLGGKRSIDDGDNDASDLKVAQHARDMAF
jgi:hypothetical protein